MASYERDLAYGLATYEDRLPTVTVSELMTKAVIVCAPEVSATDVMKLMTQRRIRPAINSWESSASAMFSSTGSESCKRKRTYFRIMPWLLGTREV